MVYRAQSKGAIPQNTKQLLETAYAQGNISIEDRITLSHSKSWGTHDFTLQYSPISLVDMIESINEKRIVQISYRKSKKSYLLQRKDDTWTKYRLARGYTRMDTYIEVAEGNYETIDDEIRARKAVSISVWRTTNDWDPLCSCGYSKGTITWKNKPRFFAKRSIRLAEVQLNQLQKMIPVIDIPFSKIWTPTT